MENAKLESYRNLSSKGVKDLLLRVDISGLNTHRIHEIFYSGYEDAAKGNYPSVRLGITKKLPSKRKAQYCDVYMVGYNLATDLMNGARSHNLDAQCRI